MKRRYKDKEFKRETMATLVTANDIIAEYQEMGYELTLRQLYYQFVARDLIPNTERSYKNLGTAISNGRLAGLIDWEAIKDRTRFSRSLSHWDSPAEIIDACIEQYRRDKWEGQENYVEVWVEKDALIDVVERAAEQMDITCFSCRGYVSQSAMYEAAKRMKRHCKYIHVLHLGDHDPSGIDMTRDIEDRLAVFTVRAEVNRLALNMDQIDQYAPPPNPAKLTDSRCREYIERYGSESWELDALDPRVLVELIRTNTANLIDWDLWDEQVKQEKTEKQALVDAAEELRERF